MNSFGADPPAAQQLPSATPRHHDGSVVYELLVVTNGSMSGAPTAFILEQPSSEELSLALAAITEFYFYNQQPDCQVTLSTLSTEGDAVQQAYACGVLDSDIRIISDETFAAYSDIISQGIDLLEARADQEATRMVTLPKTSPWIGSRPILGARR